MATKGIPQKNGEKDEIMESEVEQKDSLGDNNVTTSEIPTKGIKREHGSGEKTTPSKRRKKIHGPAQPKNALMQLNEIKPGLKYVVESMEGPSHNPVFTVWVEVNGQKFIGKGSSKQLAKHAAAKAALASFIQFEDTSEAVQAMSQYVRACDFTSDNVEKDIMIFKGFGIPESESVTHLASRSFHEMMAKATKIISQAESKNPVMILNEIHPGIVYSLVKENPDIPSQRFTMSVTVNGETFQGHGPNKRLAKAAAARMALMKLYKYSVRIPLPVSLSNQGIGEDQFTLPQGLADKIADAIYNVFSDLMGSDPEHAKWKVLAGMVMTDELKIDSIKVIAVSSGTKCINGENLSMNGAVLNDCHAEVIARRCLVDFFYSQLESYVENQESIFVKEDGERFHVKPNVKFHLFISTAPCGDGRVFCPREDQTVTDLEDRHPNRKARGVLRTKIESGEGTIPIKQNHSTLTWDGLIHGQQRLLIMSCSDKLARWNLMGLQGALLSHFVTPIYLESIILGSLFNPGHMYRAVCGRLENASPPCPDYRLNKPKLCSVSTPDGRLLNKSPSFSVNWTVGQPRVEIVNAPVGKTDANKISRLSKKVFFSRFNKLLKSLPSAFPTSARFYSEVKSSASEYQQVKNEMIRTFESGGYGRWVKMPEEIDGFDEDAF